MSIDTGKVLRAIGSGKPDWNQILVEILNLFDCSTGTIHFLDPETNLLVLKVQQGLPEALLPKVTVIPVGKGMAGIAAERKEPVQVCNLQTDTAGIAKPSAKETKVEGALTIPLLRDGQLFGTLGIAKKIPHEFSKQEIGALMEIGGQIAASQQPL